MRGVGYAAIDDWDRDETGALRGMPPNLGGYALSDPEARCKYH